MELWNLSSCRPGISPLVVAIHVCIYGERGIEGKGEGGFERRGMEGRGRGRVEGRKKEEGGGGRQGRRGRGRRGKVHITEYSNSQQLTSQ